MEGEFSSFFCWRKSLEACSTKTPPQIPPSNFTTRFWVEAGLYFLSPNEGQVADWPPTPALPYPSLGVGVPSARLVWIVLGGLQKGPAESGHVKKRQKFRAACLQNETAPKSFNFKSKNGPKNAPKLPRKMLSLVLLCRISHRHYSK